MKTRVHKRKQRERKIKRLRNTGQYANYWQQKADHRERLARSKGRG